MLTPTYGMTATERVLPRTTLNFLSGALDPLITFARTDNTATVIDSSGVVASINADLPRFDYDPTTQTLRGLLIEEARTNLCLQSAFASEYTTLGSVFTPDSLVSPSGTVTAASLIPDVTTSVKRVRRTNFTVVNGAAYTASAFVKPNGYDFAYIREGWTTGNYVLFNIVNATVVKSGGAGTILSSGLSATKFKDGWVRITMPSLAGSTTFRLEVGVCSSASQTDTTTWAGDGTSGIYVWGTQGEAGAFATSLIPTTSSTVLRNADIAAVTGGNFTGFWQATTGGAVVQARPISVSGTRPLAQFDDNTADNIISLRGNSTNPELYIKATTDQAQIDAGTIAANTVYALGGAWNTDSCAAAVSGGAAVTDTSATIPTVTQLRLGSDGTNYLNGHLQTLRYWPQRLTNAEVQAFSKL